MTREEIEALIEAEVGRRVATLTSQFGKALSERYPTTGDVERLLEERFKKEAQAVEERVEKFAKELREKDIEDENHPFSFVVEMAKAISDLQLRVMQIGMYVLAKETKVQRGPQALERTMKLSKIELLTVRLERERFRRHLDLLQEIADDHPALVAAAKDLYETLCAEPEPDTEQKPN
jgi:hypothetical protein